MTEKTPSHVTPLANVQPEPLPKALVSWQEALSAYHDAWSSLDEADDYHTAFLALHVVQNAIQAYKSDVVSRAPKDGDLANLLHLRERLDAFYALQVIFTDEPHLDYPSLRNQVGVELQNLRENVARRGTLHAIGLACTEFAPLSYSSSIDDMETIEQALYWVESYKALAPLIPQQFDIKPLASTLQAIAAAESAGFSDYKDEKFSTLFEDVTVRIGRLHLDAVRNKPAL